MSKSLRKQLLEVARRILQGTVDDAIQFAKSIAGRLDVDALMGLARAVQLLQSPGRRLASQITATGAKIAGIVKTLEERTA